MGEFDVYPVRHGSRFFNVGDADGPTDLYSREHTSYRLSQGYVGCIDLVTRVRYPRESKKGPYICCEIQVLFVQRDHGYFHLAVALIGRLLGKIYKSFANLTESSLKFKADEQGRRTKAERNVVRSKF